MLPYSLQPFLGYSRLIDEKGNLLYRIYKNQLSALFVNFHNSDNAETIEEILKQVKMESKKDFYFIINHEGKVENYLGPSLSKIFIMYIINYSKKYNGHIYGDDAEVQGTVINIPGNDGKIWTVGVRYEVVSPLTMLYFLLGFFALIGISIFILFFFSKSLSEDISLVSESLDAIATGQEDSLDNKIPVTSNDEIGSLVAAFNRIQQRVKEHIESIRKNEETITQRDRMLLIQSNQAVMGEMIGNIAHQWRQPLNAIGILAQNLRVYFKSQELKIDNIESNIKKIMELIFFMSGTIDDFRNFFRPDKEKMDFYIKDSIEKTLGIIGTNIKNDSIGVEVNTEEDLMVAGYPNEYSQVLLIILSNAKDAFKEKNITNSLIKISLFKENDKSVVTITDNAGGIDPKLINKIFDPYFTTKKTGTGIGLYMSKIIIEKNMGGKLTVKNQKDGAEFRIEI